MGLEPFFFKADAAGEFGRGLFGVAVDGGKNARGPGPLGRTGIEAPKAIDDIHQLTRPEIRRFPKGDSGIRSFQAKPDSIKLAIGTRIQEANQTVPVSKAGGLRVIGGNLALLNAVHGEDRQFAHCCAEPATRPDGRALPAAKGNRNPACSDFLQDFLFKKQSVGTPTKGSADGNARILMILERIDLRERFAKFRRDVGSPPGFAADVAAPITEAPESHHERDEMN